MGKTIAMVLGWVLLVVGVLGFIPNPIVSGDGAIFHTDLVHNLIHIVTGALLVWAARSGKAVGMLKTLGVIYLILGVIGLLMGGDMLLGIAHVNEADHWLHLALGVVLLFGGLKKAGARMASAQPSQPASSMGNSGMNSNMGGGQNMGM